MSKYSLSAVIAAGLLAGGMSISSASAADLGGNCCADLEERIAELEATTARKGNRKVSLTVSGWVGQQVMFWDDGTESNTYIHDLGTTLGSHVKFTGEATIVPGWSAGYVLHIEAISSDSLTQDQFTPSGPALYNVLGHGQGFAGDSFTAGNGTQVLQSYWFIKSDRLGKVSVGLQSQASDNTAILVDGSGSLVPANWVAFDTRSFFVRLKDGTLPAADSASRWGITQGCGNMGGVWGDCNGLTQDVVRYDSPTFGGFSVSASWGADDMWDVAGRYAGEWRDFKVSAAVAYNEVRDAQGAYNGVGQVDSNYFQAGAYVEHIPTGLFLYGAYGHYHEDDVFTTVDGSADTYYIKGGIRQRWTPLGHTVVYGEYLRGNDGGGAIAGGFNVNHLAPTDTQLDVWGVGVVQEIDAAAMSVWVKYRNLSFDDDSGLRYDDFDYVGVGALINF